MPFGSRSSAQFVLLGLPFHRARGPIGFAGRRLTSLLFGTERLGLLPIEFIDARALHLGIEHFQRSAAGIDLVVMSELGEAFEDAEQILVPAATLDLDVAGKALRTENRSNLVWINDSEFFFK